MIFRLWYTVQAIGHTLRIVTLESSSSYNDNATISLLELVAYYNFGQRVVGGGGGCPDQHIPRCDKIHNSSRIISHLHTSRSRAGGSYKDFIVNEALQEEINL